MVTRFGVRLLGIVYLALGIAGFLPFPALNPLHPEGIGARYVFNLVAINSIHNLVHIVVGLTALFSARSQSAARRWGVFAGATLLLLFAAGTVQTVLEGFPKDQMFLGIIPLNSPGHILHLVSGFIALYLGRLSPSLVGNQERVQGENSPGRSPGS
jgi:hypothetical protein